MEAAYPLPRHQTPLPRPMRKTQATGATRESNALRASVLDAALQLGLGNNSLVADWMFNESIQEDEEPVSSPGLTYGSSATSDESSSSALTPSSSHSPNPSHLKSQPFGLHFPTDVIEEESPLELNSAPGSATVGFAEPPRPTTPAVKGKLRKKPKGDGYESDGGYMSEGGKRKEKKEKEKKKKEKVKEEAESSEKPEGEGVRTSAAPSVPTSEPEERKRKKSLVSVMRGKKSAPEPAGYDTDGVAISTSKSPSKSKSKKWKSSKAESSADAGVDYETDASASSKKSKSRFFKLGGKSSKANLKEPVPALPAFPDSKEPMPLPIAERFGTTLNASTSGNDVSSSSPASPSSATIPSSAVLPSLNFKPFSHSTEDSVASNATWATAATSTTVLSSAPTTSSNPNGRFNGLRDSQASASADSSSSHSHAAKGAPLSASSTREGSYPTSPIARSTTPVSPSKQGSSFLPRAFSPLPGSRATSPSPAMRMNPPISFPITRALSPPPTVNPTSPADTSSPPTTFVSPPNTGLRVKPSLENLNMLAVRNTQPSQISPSSPYVVITPLVTPLRSTASSPALNGNQQEQQQSKLSPAPQFPARMSRAPSPMRIKAGDALYLPLPKSPAPGNMSPISGPNSGSNSQYLNVYPNGAGARRDSQLSILSSSEYIVPSPRQSPLPSPNTLAYYDIPPPSPPPMGPLPSVPLSANGNEGDRSTRVVSPLSANSNNANILPSPAALRQRVIDRSVRQLPEGFSAPIQRGKESPFPTRPILPPPSFPPPQPEPRAAGIGALAGGPAGGGGVGMGMGGPPSSGSGAAARKYRDVLPRSESPANEFIREQAEKRKLARLRPKRSVHFDDDVLADDDEDDEDEDRERYQDEVDEDDRAEMRGVLDRFEMNVQKDVGDDDEHVDSPISGTLGRRRSIEATFARQIPSPVPDVQRTTTSASRFYGGNGRKSPSPPPRSQSPEALIDEEPEPEPEVIPEPLAVPQWRPRAREPESEYTVGDRTSRWSGSVYSRNSIMDEEESEQTRGRFIDRVKAMLSEKDGSGTDYRGEYIPPVPRLPDAYASGNATSPSRWGRF
ncbi:hypothetical protein CVT24_000946 [Panaeolus cyanescens]|uniref:Uncharacterized protein n=1 Tax=Panaeolus cyanescens TaxID=181874 RepID=A0A409YCN2_9AGAR|nr:hypothetical protein CVT24_000946 [Panaeolus cyanescens]